MKRPTSVTVIGWLLIVTSIVSVVTSYFSLDNPMAQELMAKNLLPLSVQYAMLFGGLVITVIAGAAMLKGLTWGRTLYIAWSVLGLVVGLFTSPVKVVVIPGAVLLAVIAFFLYRPKAAAYFSPRQAANDA
jgi:hypothetical protein